MKAALLSNQAVAITPARLGLDYPVASTRYSSDIAMTIALS
jgi:hypothetical protein